MFLPAAYPKTPDPSEASDVVGKPQLKQYNYNHAWSFHPWPDRISCNPYPLAKLCSEDLTRTKRLI